MFALEIDEKDGSRILSSEVIYQSQLVLSFLSWGDKLYEIHRAREIGPGE